jgi:CBS domain-containing protein
VDDVGCLAGIVTQSEVVHAQAEQPPGVRAADFLGRVVIVAHPGETLRAAADRMAEHGVGALPVVEGEGRHLEGVVTAFDLLKSRQRQLHEERHRQRMIWFRRPSTG